MKNKLTIELVPSTSWMNNLRKVLKPSSWDRLRKESYKKANNRCEICGGKGLYGKGHAVECHEIWNYNDDLKVQKLEGLISLCTLCHRVKHFGFSSLRGYQEQCIKHLMRVNNWQRYQAQKYISECFKIHKERSKFQWQLDLSWLKDKKAEFKKDFSLYPSDIMLPIIITNKKVNTEGCPYKIFFISIFIGSKKMIENSAIKHKISK